MYLFIRSIYDNMITDWKFFCILLFRNECSTLVPFCPFIRHPLSKFTLRPCSSNLTNLENSTSNFCQSVQICCREEQKEENNGYWKAFYVTRKCNN